MGEGTKENPYTRKDVLRLIEENGGTAEGLDLSEKVFEEAIDLRDINLSRIILKQAKFLTNFEKFEGAHLEAAYLITAHLEGAYLIAAHLEEAYLTAAHLEETDLRLAHLEGAYLTLVEFTRGTKLKDVDWGNYKLGEERKGYFLDAVDAYRRLRTWHTEHGIYDVAGEFFYREMEAKRKALKWWSNPFPRAWSKFLSLICGYGERPLRVIGWAATVVFGLAAGYYFWGSFSSSSFWDTLYYSIASFTALGYGQWAPQPTGWAKGMGAAEAFIGVFTMALFIVTFVRKMTR